MTIERKPTNREVTEEGVMQSSMSIEQKYEVMKRKLASYSMGICASIAASGGRVSEHFRYTTKQSGLVKAKRRGGNPTPDNLAAELVEMLEEFSTAGVRVNRCDGSVEVINETCGCLEPFVSQASAFGLTVAEARNYACANCIPAYRLMTQKLGLEFEGGLTPPKADGGRTVDNHGGCTMKFSLPNDE